MRRKIENFDEAISGVLFHEIATQPTAARNGVMPLFTQFYIFLIQFYNVPNP
ncbi:hypothetical protein [Rickettsia felis]|uniref:hypothetical protein n=1 Tax=Rickettsia felis TaxID=42862 RepID=UPI0012E01521|nr:hypothetical protein [Rickettsia felis]